MKTEDISVYVIGKNCASTLREALESILKQTCSVGEILYLDDGSTDNSVEVANSFSGRGVKIVRNEATQGIPYSRNKAVRATSGRWIAVLDSDDRWHLNKIEMQCSFLKDNPSVGLLGSSANVIDTEGNDIGLIRVTETDSEIKSRELIGNCFVHSAAIFRRDLYDAVGGYADLAAAQDYDLLLKISERTTVANLPEPLVDYRISEAATSVKKRRVQAKCAQTARAEAYRRRRERYTLRLRVLAFAHALFESLVLFNPRIHWGVHQLLTSNFDRGRSMLRQATKQGLRSRMVASCFLLVPNAGYRALVRLLS